MADVDPIIERVARLLALAEGSGTTPNEAAVAAAQAQKLMLRHKLTRADVVEGTSTVDFDDRALLRGKRIRAWELALANAVARTNGCVLLMQSPPDEPKKCLLVGNERDMLLVRYLFQHLRKEVNRLAQEQKHVLGYRPYQFRMGAVYAIALKLEETRKSVERESVTAAIVLRKDSARVEEWVREQVPGIGFDYDRSYQADQGDPSFWAGFSQGSQLDVSGPEGKIEG